MMLLVSKGGESTRLPLIWSGFKSQRRRHNLCELSLLSFLHFALRGFSPRTPVFPSPQKQHFQIPIRPGIRYTLSGFVISKSLFKRYTINIWTWMPHYITYLHG